MQQKVLKIKDWLIERDIKPQFEFITEVCVKRLKDDVLFKVGQTDYSTIDGNWFIHHFSNDRIHISVHLINKEWYKIWAINDLPPY